MYRLPNQILFGLLSLVPLVGCAFSPGTPGEEVGTGGASSTGSGVGSGGVSGITTGQGLTGGDIGVTGAAGTMSCGQATVPIMPLPPDILIVQDKSLSMNENAAGDNCNTAGCSKWSQVSAAIDSVVMATQTTVNWGLVFFGTNSTCGTTSTPVVPVEANAYTAINTAFTGNQPASYTPTAAAMNAAVTYMNTLTDMNPKYILLATDGLPNCGAGGNMTADDSPNAEAAVTTAKTAGYPTFVVGIGNTMGDATLNVMAVNGGEPQVGSADGNSFYSVQSTTELEAALNKIVGIIASCTISLSSAPTGFTNVVISATDASGKPVAIPMDPTNGWSYDANKANVILNGTACANLQNGTYSDFNFNYACEGVTICIDKNPDGTCAS
jgi:von Willebrand factor type A domain